MISFPYLLLNQRNAAISQQSQVHQIIQHFFCAGLTLVFYVCFDNTILQLLSFSFTTLLLANKPYSRAGVIASRHVSDGRVMCIELFTTFQNCVKIDTIYG